MPLIYCKARFIKNMSEELVRPTVMQKGFPKIGGPLKPLCVHSVMISVLFLNFRVPIAKCYFSTGKEGQQSWHI